MADIVVDIEAISTNITTLNKLFDELESGVQAVNRVVGQQTTAVWTDIPSCAQFAAEYKNSLQILYGRLTDAWGKISTQAHALNGATSALVATDRETAESNGQLATRLNALLERADKGPSPLDLTAITQAVAAAGAFAGVGTVAGVGPVAGPESFADAISSSIARTVAVNTARSIVDTETLPED